MSDICFFILAASTIVEVMDAHQGFRIITKLLETNNKKVRERGRERERGRGVRD